MATKVTGDVETKVCERIVERLGVLMRTLVMHGPDHPMADKAAAATAQAINDGRPPYALQFIAGGLFRDRVVVPVDVERFGQLRQLSRALHNLSMHELSVDEPLRVSSVHTLGRMLARAASGPIDVDPGLVIPGLRWRVIPGFTASGDSVVIDPSMFSAMQVVAAIAEAAEMSGNIDDPWPWKSGISVVRRLERAVLTAEVVTKRTLELLPGKWTIARRAVSACLMVMQVLESLGVDRITRRASSHAALAVAIQGLTDREGMELRDAAGILGERFVTGVMQTATGIDPHRLRAVAIVHFIASARTREEAPMGVLGLIHLAYYLERHRRPRGLSSELSLADLMAYAVRFSGDVFDPVWVRALTAVIGPVPPGTPVRLASGDLGVAIGPGPTRDPWLPLVSSNGNVTAATSPIRLVSPLER